MFIIESKYLTTVFVKCLVLTTLLHGEYPHHRYKKKEQEKKQVSTNT